MKCLSCDIDLHGTPEMLDGEPFCCAGCAAGGPCVCTYERGPGRYPHNGHVDTVLAAELMSSSLDDDFVT